MALEERHDRDLGPIAETQGQRQHTLDAAIAEMLAALEGMGRRLSELEAKYQAKRKAQYLAALEAHLDRRCTRADFFDDRAGGFRA